MSVEPEFFARRTVGAVPDATLDLSRATLLAAIDAALASPAERTAASARALRWLRETCFEAPARSLVGLTFPLDAGGMEHCLEEKLADWLPCAAALGIADERLMFLGLPTSACRDLPYAI